MASASKSPASTPPARRRSFITRSSIGAIGMRGVERRYSILVLLKKKIRPDCQSVHVGVHETIEGLAGCADDGLAPYVEAGIYDEAASCFFLECGYHLVIAGIIFFWHRLEACRVVEVRDR